MYPALPGGPNVITGVFKRGRRQGCQNQRDGILRRNQLAIDGLKTEGAKESTWRASLNCQTRKRIPESFQKGMRLCWHSVELSETSYGFLTPTAVRYSICVVVSHHKPPSLWKSVTTAIDRTVLIQCLLNTWEHLNIFSQNSLNLIEPLSTLAYLYLVFPFSKERCPLSLFT